jgi:hypothetical protein
LPQHDHYLVAIVIDGYQQAEKRQKTIPATPRVEA